MYYHCRPLKYVEYGKVMPPPIDEVSDWLLPAYKWLSNYCGGYCPQVWLSRSRFSITGYKTKAMLKKREHVMGKRSDTKERLDSVLFGFDIIPGGYPVSYSYWEMVLMFLDLNNNKTFQEQNKHMAKEITDLIKSCREQDGLKDEDFDPEMRAWNSCNGDFDLFLKKYVFVESDQIVVPSLNLKCSKQIICKDEKQKKALRRMGFIEDRIKIKNIKHRPW